MTAEQALGAALVGSGLQLRVTASGHFSVAPLPREDGVLNLGSTSQSHTLGYERTYEVPGYTVWNARVAYQLTPEVNLAVNANNLFDKNYWVAGFNQLNGSNNYGEPRNFLFTVKYTPQL